MKQNENGRSMIEMLGVLAIIGVLSVGGLLGYAKMMAQHRINATLQQVQIISSKLSTMAVNGGSFKGMNNYTAYKLNAIPSELVSKIEQTEVGEGEETQTETTATLTNVYGGEVEIAAASIASGTCAEGCDNQAYTITYTGLHEEACVALGGSSWNSSRNSSFIGFGVGTSVDNIKSALYQGCSGENGDGFAVACAGTSSFPMNLDDVADACTCGSGTCVLVLKFF